MATEGRKLQHMQAGTNEMPGGIRYSMGDSEMVRRREEECWQQSLHGFGNTGHVTQGKASENIYLKATGNAGHNMATETRGSRNTSRPRQMKYLMASGIR